MTQITIDRALVEQALEALEDAKALLNSKDSTTTMWFADQITALRAALAQQADPAQNYWFEDWNGAVRSRPEDCVAWGANGRPAAVWVNKVRYTPPAKKEEPPCP